MNRNEELVCGLDPGRDKCGLAVVDNQGSCLYHEIVSTVQLEEQLKQLQGKYGFSTLVMGNGTTSKEAGARVGQSLPEVKLQVVDEYRTTDEAKEEWWCFTKDGEDVMTGVDSTPVADGDHFEITLKTGY